MPLSFTDVSYVAFNIQKFMWRIKFNEVENPQKSLRHVRFSQTSSLSWGMPTSYQWNAWDLKSRWDEHLGAELCAINIICQPLEGNFNKRKQRERWVPAFSLRSCRQGAVLNLEGRCSFTEGTESLLINGFFRILSFYLMSNHFSRRVQDFIV